MKNVLKAFGVIALAAVIGFSFAACGGDGGGLVGGYSEISGVVTAGEDDYGRKPHIWFEYADYSGENPYCTITTDLPAPADSFTVSDEKTKRIYLPNGYKVKWTAKIEKGTIGRSYDVYHQSTSETGVYIFSLLK